MSTCKHIDRICWAAIALALILTAVLMNGSALGIQASGTALGYEERLFDTSVVHTIDISMDDWEGFLEGCTDEEYVLCDLTIDGESCRNVAIRAKGNTSLTQVAAYGNDRYSFKVEFDHYDASITYHGLDKLCLNNIIQDNTYMKDYLTYQMMGYFGVNAPLCSFVRLTVNGEDWGLYLAVEGVEEAFLERSYGSGYGELYKPDSVSMGGGRGNGGAFDMEDWLADREDGAGETFDPETFRQEMGDRGTPGMEGAVRPKAPQDGTSDGALSGELPEGAEAAPEGGAFGDPAADAPPESGGRQFGGGMGGGMMGGDDVSLIYTDDDYDSYSNIFDSAKTDLTDADKDRLIASLKQLNEGENIQDVVDVDQVIRYFVVHNFVCNFDSYTGSMIHNYYLYEEDGRLSMIPWDYNLAFGGFQGSEDAEALVNYPIDTPVSGGTVDSRPMLAWIFADEEYTRLYHQYFDEFIAGYFESGYFAQMMAETKALIAPYVEQDPTKFCTYEEFETGFDTLEQFCLLRAESIRGQLEGTIPSTDEGQSADNSALVDASDLEISDMGSMNNGGMGSPGRGKGDLGREGTDGVSAFLPSGDLQTAEGAPADVSPGAELSPAADGASPEEMIPAKDWQAASDRDSPSDTAGATAAPNAGTRSEEADRAPEWNQAAEADGSGTDHISAAELSQGAGTELLTDRTGENAWSGAPGQSAAAASKLESNKTLLLLGTSGIVLLTGLAIAVLYRRRA